MSKQSCVITSDDLPGLLADIGCHAANECFSDRYRSICRETITVINLAIAEDAATHTRLKLALECYMNASDDELHRHGYETSHAEI